MKKYLRKKLVNWITKDLFNAVTEDDILRVEQKQSGVDVFYRGKKLEPDRIQQLSEDAERLLNSLIWQVLKDDIKFQANRRMFYKSKNSDDMIAGKVALHNLQIIEEKLKELAELS